MYEHDKIEAIFSRLGAPEYRENLVAMIHSSSSHAGCADVSSDFVDDTIGAFQWSRCSIHTSRCLSHGMFFDPVLGSDR
jgi:hypothetical protein